MTVAAAHGDAALYEQYLARSKAAVDPEDRYRFLYGLTSFTDPRSVRRTMDTRLGRCPLQDTKLVIAQLLGNEAARPIVWDMLRERWDAVQKKTGEFVGNTVIVNGLPASATRAGRRRSRPSLPPIRCRTPNAPWRRSSSGSTLRHARGGPEAEARGRVAGAARADRVVRAASAGKAR